jgi:hypothetical protein
MWMGRGTTVGTKQEKAWIIPTGDRPRHSRHHLSLLPSGPDEVRERLLRGDQQDDPGVIPSRSPKTHPRLRSRSYGWYWDRPESKPSQHTPIFNIFKKKMPISRGSHGMALTRGQVFYKLFNEFYLVALKYDDSSSVLHVLPAGPAV